MKYHRQPIGSLLRAFGIPIVCLLAVLFLTCVGISKQACGQILFEEVHREAGLNSPHLCDGDQPLLPRLMVAGLAIFDYDNDGLDDILLLNQSSSPHLQLKNAPPALPSDAGLGRLYRNVGRGKFVDVTQSAGLKLSLFALGVVTGDYDNDGDQDLFISCFGDLKFFINQGDGTFECSNELVEDVPSSAVSFGAGLALLDFDNDGLLDLFEGRYVEFSIAKYEAQLNRSFPYPPGPKDFPGAVNRLVRNLGDGKFTDVTKWAGLQNLSGPTMGVIAGDWDGDFDVDLFLCSDAAPNQYLVNNGIGQFVDQAATAGLAYDLTGNVNGSMGVDSGDFDNDGLSDLIITNYTGQIPVLYRNLGAGMFEDVSRKTQIGRTVLPHTNWGVAWIDVDNDGDLDAFISNGHFLKNIQLIDSRTDYQVANTLMENLGGSRFRDISKSAGPGLVTRESSRAVGFSDLDLDGDLDGIVLNAESTPSLLRNSSLEQGNWLSVRLIGLHCNRDAVGAQVSVKTANTSFVSTVHAGRGYQSHYGTQLHFGLGPNESIESIEVRWPGGKSESFNCPHVNQRLKLTEGTGHSQ